MFLVEKVKAGEGVFTRNTGNDRWIVRRVGLCAAQVYAQASAVFKSLAYPAVRSATAPTPLTMLEASCLTHHPKLATFREVQA